MMNEVVKKAVEEWSKVETHEEYLAFSRKLYTAEAMGIISKEELVAVKKMIEQIKHENFLKMMKEDVERLEEIEKDVVRRYLGM
ncbi:MAG TPA: hypothetical protein DHV37_05705 [Erysipelotrichaceae bacterium]|nr:hypothetical protein [Erysipelotrichaceae bacterium]